MAICHFVCMYVSVTSLLKQSVAYQKVYRIFEKIGNWLGKIVFWSIVSSVEYESKKFFLENELCQKSKLTKHVIPTI